MSFLGCFFSALEPRPTVCICSFSPNATSFKTRILHFLVHTADREPLLFHVIKQSFFLFPVSPGLDW